MLRPRNAIPKLPLTTIKFFINYISHDQSKTIGDSKNFALIQIMFIFLHSHHPLQHEVFTD